ncbi:MAG: LytTR family DNA-binding domain-containing protein [Spirosomataceae bacterium]
MTAILIDDEKTALEALKIKLGKVAPQVQVVATFTMPNEAILAIPKLDPSVLFLDVEMPTMDGFSLLNQLKDADFEVIFTTAYSQYAINAFRTRACDYLLKPINETELAEAIARLETKLEIKQKEQSNAQTPIRSGRISIPSMKGLQFIPVEDIIWLASERNYTNFYLRNGQHLIASRTLKEFENLLVPYGFIRVHHSSLINSQHVVEYLRGEGGTVILSDGTEVEVSKRRKQEFLTKISW